MSNDRDITKRLKTVLLTLLGEQNLNALGQYKLTDKSRRSILVPSIQVVYRRLTNDIEREMVKGSGIECLIEPEPDTVARNMAFSNRDVRNYYSIVLIQHNPDGHLDEAIDYCMRCRLLNITEEPSRIGETTAKDGSGILEARAILTHCQGRLLESF